jgi:hypothetical protein
MAGARDIVLYAGDTYVHELRLRNSANAVINISSHTFSGQIRLGRSATDNVATFTTQITDGANGVVQLSLAANTTAAMTAGTYYYDIQQINGAIVTTLLAGKAIVQGDVTRAS